jgi:hypothetical protein
MFSLNNSQLETIKALADEHDRLKDILNLIEEILRSMKKNGVNSVAIIVSNIYYLEYMQ